MPKSFVVPVSNLRFQIPMEAELEPPRLAYYLLFIVKDIENFVQKEAFFVSNRSSFSFACVPSHSFLGLHFNL